MHRRAVVNFIASSTLKALGLLYSVAIVGMAARQIPMKDTALLLLVFSFLAPLGLVQAGMGAFVLRAVIHNHAQNGSIASIPEIGMAFRLSLLLSLVALSVATIAAHRAGLDFVIPTIALVLVGSVCSVADQVWIGTEKAWVVNICLACAFLVLSIIFIVMRLVHNFDLSLISVITYGVPAIASILSFATRMRQRDFRVLFVARGSDNTARFLRMVLPTFMVSLASAALVVLPTAALLWPVLPRLAANEVPLFRLSTISASATVTILVPLLPTLIVSIYRMGAAERRRMAWFWTLGIVGLVVCLTPVLYLALPYFLKLWIGLRISDNFTLLPWALVIALWMGAGISGQFALMTSSPLAVAGVVAACDASIMALMLSKALGSSVTVSQALICGLTLHIMLALVLIHRHLRQSHS